MKKIAIILAVFSILNISSLTFSMMKRSFNATTTNPAMFGPYAKYSHEYSHGHSQSYADQFLQKHAQTIEPAQSQLSTVGTNATTINAPLTIKPVISQSPLDQAQEEIEREYKSKLANLEKERKIQELHANLRFLDTKYNTEVDNYKKRHKQNLEDKGLNNPEHSGWLADSPERRYELSAQELELKTLRKRYLKAREYLQDGKTLTEAINYMEKGIIPASPTPSSKNSSTSNLASSTPERKSSSTSSSASSIPEGKSNTSSLNKTTSPTTATPMTTLKSIDKGYGARLIEWGMSKVGFGALGRAEKTAKKIAADRIEAPGPELKNALAPLSKEQREHVFNKWLQAWADQEYDADFQTDGLPKMKVAIYNMITYMNKVLPQGETLVLTTRQTPKRDAKTRKTLINIQDLQFEVADNAELRDIQSQPKYDKGEFGKVIVYDKEADPIRKVTQTFDKEAPNVIKTHGVAALKDAPDFIQKKWLNAKALTETAKQKTPLETIPKGKIDQLTHLAEDDLPLFDD